MVSNMEPMFYYLNPLQNRLSMGRLDSDESTNSYESPTISDFELTNSNESATKSDSDENFSKLDPKQVEIEEKVNYYQNEFDKANSAEDTRRIIKKLNTQLSIENAKKLLSKSNPEVSEEDEEDCLHANDSKLILYALVTKNLEEFQSLIKKAEKLFKNAKILVRDKKIDEAIKLLKKSLTFNPNNKEVIGYYDCILDLTELKLANDPTLIARKKIEEKNPRHKEAELLFEKAKILVRNKKSYKSINLLKESLTLNTNNEEVKGYYICLLNLMKLKSADDLAQANIAKQKGASENIDSNRLKESDEDSGVRKYFEEKGHQKKENDGLLAMIKPESANDPALRKKEAEELIEKAKILANNKQIQQAFDLLNKAKLLDPANTEVERYERWLLFSNGLA